MKIKGEGFLGFLVSKSERGKEKVGVDNISKGILKDGLNMQENNTYFSINGDGQPSLDDFNRFISEFSDYIGKEIAGVKLGEERKHSGVDLGSTIANAIAMITGDEVSGVLTYRYKNNTRYESHTPESWMGSYNKQIGNHQGYFLKGHFHTHPDKDHTPSKQFDMRLKAKHPNLRFFIIAGGHEKEF